MPRPANIFRLAAAALLFVAFVAAIFSTARLESQAAISPKGRSDIALQQAIAAEMNANEYRNYARDIALSDPMHAVGFFLEVVALDLEEAPSFDNRRVLIAEASRRQPAFAAPRIWLTADDVRNERYAQAIDGADTVMRLNGEFRKLLVPILAPLLANDKAFPLLEAKLKSYPIWRTEFISEAISSGADEARVEGLLRHTPPPANAAAIAVERSTYLKNLVARGEAMRARTVWQNFMPDHAKHAVFDGNFAAKHPVFPFAWSYASDPYSYAEKTAAAVGGKPLVRAHHGGDGKIDLLTQLVALRPGANLLTFTMRDGGLSEPKNLFWQVRCMGSAAAIASRSLAKLGNDWQKIQMQVAVPDSGCALQYLVLTAQDNDGDEAEVEILRVEAR